MNLAFEETAGPVNGLTHNVINAQITLISIIAKLGAGWLCSLIMKIISSAVMWPSFTTLRTIEAKITFQKIECLTSISRHTRSHVF